MDFLEIDTSKFIEVRAGYLVRCIKHNQYAELGEIKKVDSNTQSFYGMMVGNEYFEIVSKGETYTQRALKDAFSIGNDKMNEDFKNALIRGC